MKHDNIDSLLMDMMRQLRDSGVIPVLFYGAALAQVRVALQKHPDKIRDALRALHQDLNDSKHLIR